MDHLATFFDQIAFGFYEIKSLALQEEMARWAFWALFTSACATIVSALALIGLFRSLAHTRAALNLSRDLGHAQIRAYVSILEDEVTVDIGDVTADRLTAKLRASNFGETPAMGFRYAAAIFVREQTFPKKNDKIMPISDGITPSSVLSRGAKSSIEAHLAVEDRVEFLRCLRSEHPTKAVFVMGCLQYEDVFGGARETRFCYEMVTRPMDVATDAVAVQWKLTPLHNSMM